MKGNKRKKNENNALLKTLAYGLESRVFGFAKSMPADFKATNISEAVTVNAKPIRNWIKILFCFPKRRPEMTDDKTNIHAKEQTKIATVMLLLNHEANEGVETLSEDATVVSAVLVKIW
jgi:hypothetical protein